LTGIATTFAGYVVALGSHSLFLSLVLTMITCLVLGMGIPTIPNYIITSAIAAPALLDLGVPLIVSHMFVFYFGIMADLTPPVALAAFAAAPIARESGLKIGIRAVQIAIAGFIVPYMAVYAPALMLQFSGEADWLAAGYAFGKALLAVSLWGVVAIGFWLRHLLLGERVLAFLAACLLVAASLMALCLTTAVTSIKLLVTAFTLVWTHSIEKIDWQEQWQVQPDGLQLLAATVRGSGAGMEVPDGAVWHDGAWTYALPLRVPALRLTRSPYVACACPASLASPCGTGCPPTILSPP